MMQAVHGTRPRRGEEPDPAGSSELAVGCGIDFGTSNSAIAIAYASRVDVVGFGPGRQARTIPSIVYVHRDGSRLAGLEAVREFFATGHRRTKCRECSLAPYGVTECRQFRWFPDEACADARLLAGLKHDLAKGADILTNSWVKDFTIAELVSIVLARLRAEAEAVSGAELRRVVLGHPVVFAGAEGLDADKRQAAGLDRLEQAAIQAGFSSVSFLSEPAAAGLGEDDEKGISLSVDFGGGTFDTAIMDFRGTDLRITGLMGAPVGGERLDQAVFEAIVGPALGLQELPNWLFNDMRSLSSVGLLLADPGAASLLNRINTPAAKTAQAILYQGNAYDFYSRIEMAKIELSTSDSARIQFSTGGIDLDIPVSRSHFESVIKPELDLVDDVISASLESEGLAPDDIDRVLVTGGSSLIPAFQGRLRGRFGAERIEHRDAFVSVAQGLGIRAQELWA